VAAAVSGLALMALTAACGAVRDDGPGAQPPAAGSCPGPRATDSRVMIDYVDFVSVGGVQYLNRDRFAPVTVPLGRVGRQLGTVRCRLAESDARPDRRPADGDAAFLPPGTAIYAVSDRPVPEAVAALVDGTYVLYLALPAPSGPAPIGPAPSERP